MKLALTEDEVAFRDELRAWLAETLPTVPPEPPHDDDWTAKRAYDTGWQRRLYDAGYAGIAWPKEFGGRGATPTEELIFLEETEKAGAPYVGCNFVGTLHAGPTIGAEATDEQKARYLPGILKGENVWCQGFSEPGAGSDLASLRTKAVRDGDHYVVSGQKIWTSHAQVADYCELLVRTDPDAPKHKGITWMVMPMDSPGLEIRPMKTLTGVSEFSEMFLDEVRIPVENRVGDEHDGWRVAMVTFSFERGTAFVSELLGSFRLVADLAEVARKTGAWDDDHVRRELAISAAELEAQWAMTKRNVSRAARFGTAGVGGSVFKLAYHETKVRLGDLAMEVLGRAGLAMGDPAGLASADHVERRLYTLSLSIAAGTAQIQRNIVGERMLGLPRGALMDLEPTDDQNSLRDELRRFLGARVDSDARRAMAEQPGAVDRGVWRELASMGVFGLPVAEDAGGVGLGWAEAVIVFEELGRAAVPGPVIATALAAAVGGLDIDGAVDGSTVVGMVEAGDPLLIEHLDGLDVLVVLDGDAVVVAEPPSGGSAARYPLDPLTPVTLVPGMPAGRSVDAEGVAAELRAGSALLSAALQVGLGTAALELGTEYAKQREQFGRVIGSFQAVKHMLADGAVGLEIARAAVHAAAVARDEDAAGHRVETARIVASRAARTATEACIQVHGGMGYTWELDAHLFLKRVLVLDQAPGSLAGAVDAVAATL